MELQLSPDDQVFRDDVHSFLRSSLPDELRRAWALTTTVFAEHDISQAWHRILYRKGWAAPGWPREHGGTGWTQTQRSIWQTESARAGAPVISPIAFLLVGPVLLHFGTEAQKRHFLPRILRGEDTWCQGFSEPGAGSDLAALQTRAIVQGETYRVTGSKIWTTHAHFANWMIALVRTSTTGKRQQGITCLLIDMKSPGISVRPILTIGGDHEVNQVFIDEVVVPVSNRLGAEGEGWSVAKYLLEFERGGSVESAGLRADLAHIATMDGHHEHMCGIADVAIDIDALEMMELQAAAARASGEPPGPAASMLKLRASQLQQDVSALALKIAGDRALRWEPHRPLYDFPSSPLDAIRPVMSRYLNSRANTIFGGSSEVQKSIIARSVLGL